MYFHSINKRTLKKSVAFMENFNNTFGDVVFYSAYVHMIELMYVHMLKILHKNGTTYRVEDSGFEPRYKKFSVMKKYINFYGLRCTNSTLKKLILFRNELVHRPGIIANLKRFSIYDMPNYMDMLELSNNIYRSDICAIFFSRGL